MNGDLTPLQSSRRFVWALAALLLVLAGCAMAETPEPETTATASMMQQTEEPVRPPEGALPPDDDAIPSADTPVAVGPQPPLEGTVLVTLEGPATNRAATDVVLRRETGEILESFRLPNASHVHARSGDRWAVVEMLGDSWAVLDTAIPRLRLLTFPSNIPRVTPQLVGPVALWADDDGSVLLRMDGTQALDLPGVIGAQATLEMVSADGSRALIGGDVPGVLDVATGQALDINPSTRFTLGRDGAVTSIAETATGGVMQTQGPEEEAPRDIVNLDQPAGIGTEPAEPGVGLPPAGSRLPISLADGRFLIAGPTSVVVEADGSVVQFPATGSIIGVPQLSVDGQRVILQTAVEIVIADVAAGTVQPVPNSAGHVIATPGGRLTVWTISQEPTAAGVIAIDTLTGESSLMLEDVPTIRIDSFSTDGGTVVVEAGEGTPMLVGAAESQMPDLPGDLISVALHPDGLVTAWEMRLGASQSVQINGSGTPSDITEAWSPAWLDSGS